MNTHHNLEARLLAFYLPQFHPIPENDQWWGRGFTEWTNVTKSKPLFPGHYQPHLPADLGFYDLRVPEVRQAQADLAQAYGLEGFCYWHYWFGGGRRILERPFQEVLQSGEPNFPFCLAWANQTWSGIWHGCPDRILIEQVYPGKEDYKAHFFKVLDAFMDERYIKIKGKPLFVIYYPRGLPNALEFTDYWRELADQAGLPGLYFVGIAGFDWEPERFGFDAFTSRPPGDLIKRLPRTLHDRILQKLLKINAQQLLKNTLSLPLIYEYSQIIEFASPTLAPDLKFFPSVMPNWDNTPRSGTHGVVFHNSTPELFREHLRKAITQVSRWEPEERIIFIKSWNEWAEGNHLEPDQKFGPAYLEAIKAEVAPLNLKH